MLTIEIKETWYNKEEKEVIIKNDKEVIFCEYIPKSHKKKQSCDDLSEEFFSASHIISEKRHNEQVEFNHIDHDKYNRILDLMFKLFKPEYSELLKLNIQSVLEEDDTSEEEKINKINLLILES